jgi:hypothetical protein
VTVAEPVAGELFGGASSGPLSVVVYTDWLAAAGIATATARSPAVNNTFSFMIVYPFKGELGCQFGKVI